MQTRKLIAVLCFITGAALATRAGGAQSENAASETKTQSAGNADSKQKAAAGATDETEKGSTAEISDAAFLRKAVERGLREKNLGALASTRGASDAVKEFGRKMYDEHSRLNAQLRLLAAERHLTVPKDSPDKPEPALTRLEQLSGADFDKACAEQTVKDHKQAIQDFQRAARSAQDASIKAFAEKTLPQLKEHLEHAQHLTAKKTKASP